MSTSHGTRGDGTSISDEAVEAMADEAEQGYDVDAIQRRRGGRPPIGSSAAGGVRPPRSRAGARTATSRRQGTDQRLRGDPPRDRKYLRAG